MVIRGFVAGLVIAALAATSAIAEPNPPPGDRVVCVSKQINEFIYATVMESRGIYMSTTIAESEKYAPLVLQDVDRIAQIMKRWQVSGSVDPMDIRARNRTPLRSGGTTWPSSTTTLSGARRLRRR